MIAFIASFTVTSCGSSDETINEQDNEVKLTDDFPDNVADYYGIEIGQSRETVKRKLPIDAYDGEDEMYVFYYWDLGDKEYYLDLFFDEKNELRSIDVFTYGDDESDGGGNADSAKCTQWDSKNAVEERIESLGYLQLSINLNDNVDCRYQWLVQIISDNGESGYCAITTDGSSGVVEIVDVTCM